MHIVWPSKQGEFVLSNRRGQGHQANPMDHSTLKLIPKSSTVHPDGSWLVSFSRSMDGIPSFNADYIWAAGVGDKITYTDPNASTLPFHQ